MFKNLKYKVKWFIQDLKFLKSLFSPFKPFGLKFYAGKIAIGTPYFYPRKWVKFTKEDIIKAANEAMADPKLVKKSYDEWLKHYKGYTKAVPRKVGFDFVSLGWKTKWSDTDYRFEWSPILSFVFFGYQIAVITKVEHPDQYWTSWLYYENNTDKTKSKKERIAQCIKEHPITWTSYYGDGKQETIDYYTKILRKKYLKND